MSISTRRSVLICTNTELNNNKAVRRRGEIARQVNKAGHISLSNLVFTSVLSMILTSFFTMKPRMLFFTLMLNQLFYCESLSHQSGWRVHVSKSLSYNLQLSHKNSYLVHSLHVNIKTYRSIKIVCHQKSFTNCHGRLEGLCGSVEMQTDRLMDCTWDLQVPDNLCINVTINSFPNGDPFTIDYFSLSIKDKNDITDRAGVKLYLNQDHSSVITNTSNSLVQLKILKLFSVSKFKFHFQAIECHAIVSHNAITIVEQDSHIFDERSRALINRLNSKSNNSTDVTISAVQTNVTISVNTMPFHILVKPDSTKTMKLMPYAYYPLNDMTEFHILLRTTISSLVNIKFQCNYQLTLHDGPSFKFPKINFTCKTDEITDITAGSFQLYIVYQQATSRAWSNLNISFFGVFPNIDYSSRFYIDQGSEVFKLSWDFTNSSHSYYVQKNIECSKYTCPLHYQIDVSNFKDSLQGYLCQFYGIMLKGSRYDNVSPSLVGPLCSETQMLMIKHKTLNSICLTMHVIIYDYGFSNLKGDVFFPKLPAKQSCIGIINPCSYCSLPSSLHGRLSTGLGISGEFKLSCNGKEVAISVRSRCVTVYFISNMIEETNKKTCIWRMMAAGSLSLKFKISLIYEEKSKRYCDVKLKDLSAVEPFVADSFKGRVKILEYPQFIVQSRSHQFFISYKCFINYFLQVFVEIAPPEALSCQTVNLSPLRKLPNVPKFQGPCFMCLLDVENDIFNFEVSFLGEATNEYPNQFAVAAYTEKLPIKHVSIHKKRLILTISDKMPDSEIFYSYKFTDEQMPFVWQSFGKHLTISLNATQNDQPLFMWIIVNAIFETHSLYSYIISPINLPLAEHCLKNNRLSMEGKNCFSVHKNFTGSWLESEEMCKEKGGELWNADNEFDWNDVMRSSRTTWYLENDERWQPVEYDGQINALHLLCSSSVMYLKSPEHDQAVSMCSGTSADIIPRNPCVSNGS